MACVYEYKGHRFNNELELNDFLLEKENYLSKYGDIVFERSSQFLHAKSQVDSLIQESKELKKKLDQSKKTYIDGEIQDNPNPPYTGVNTFLSGLKDSEGNLLFPEFNEDEYWKRRYDAWDNLEYTDDERELFFNDPNSVTRLPKSQYQNYREIMEDKWKHQAEYGETVHSIFQIFFSKIKSGQNAGQIVGTMSDNFLENIYLPKMLDMNTINKKCIHDAIKLAREFKTQLEQQFGSDLDYYPEVSVMGESIQEVQGKGNKVLGRLDLLIIDGKGNTHIVDYKTSPKPFYSQGGIKGYNSAKQLAFTYQLAVYNRILQRHGIDVSKSDMLIVPLQLTNFRKEGDKYVYDSIDPIQPESKTNDGKRIPPILWHSIKNKIEHSFNIQKNLQEFFPEKIEQEPVSEKLSSNVTSVMKQFFKEYQSPDITDEEILEEFKEQKSLTPINGYLNYKLGQKEFSVSEKEGEAVLLKKVKDYYKLLENFKVRTTENISSNLEKAMTEDDFTMKLPKISVDNRYENANWLSDILHKYTQGSWEIVNCEQVKQYGLILLRNKITGQIDVKKVTSRPVMYLRHFNPKSNLLSGGLIEDSVENISRSSVRVGSDGKMSDKSLMLESRNGNIELIETMLILNNLKSLFSNGSSLGSVEILNPYAGRGMTASNEELVYTVNRLCKLSNQAQTEFGKDIRVCSKYQLALDELTDILTTGKNKQWLGDYKQFQTFESCLNDLDKANDNTIPEKIRALEDFISRMENEEQWTRSLQSFEYTQDKLVQNYRRLYNTAQLALSDLRGINFRQQNIESSDWINSIQSFNKGIQGNKIDNPGNLASDTLNLITKQTTIAYQNVRDSLREPVAKLHELVAKVKQEYGFNLSGNRVNIFKNLYENPEKVGGDFRFKLLSDPTLKKSEKELLQYCLRLINKNRLGYSDKLCEEAEKKGNIDYYKVPLAVGGMESQVAQDGLLKSLKIKLKGLAPSRIMDDFSNKMKGVGYAEENDELTKANSDLFNMNTTFDWGEAADRQDIINRTIAKHGSIGYFEHNLETLTLKHYFAYSMKNNINKVFPIMKAAMSHIAYQGFIANHNFQNDINYMQDYIRNKIKNESIIPKNVQLLSEYTNKIKTIASYSVLAFSPVQGLYQSIQGIWNDIRLIIQKPDMVGKYGKSAFTLKNVSDSFASAYKDLFVFSDKETINSLINKQYALNDMDMNQYVERVQSQPSGIFNFNSWAMKFSSRPDYYNRLTIFGAQMRADGCWEAHSIKDGKLIYDWRKDKRFELFANDKNVGSDEYNYQRALYYEMCQQFVNEHTKNSDGTDFNYVIGEKVALPKAYTNLQAESYKSLSDDIYGYYSHEKKAMLHATWIGSMFMQFKTFWTGKKNQYFGSGGFKLRGSFQQLTDPDGNLLYYKVDENGKITEDLTTKKTSFPAIKWQGQWQEGIAVTLASAMSWNPIKTSKNLYEQWYSTNPQLRNAYRSNYKQLMFDLFMWVIIGNIAAAGLTAWLKDLKEESKLDPNPIKLAAANVLAKSINNSLMDFNIYDSFVNPWAKWTPFMFSWAGNTARRLWNTIFGSTTFLDCILKTFSATNQLKPGLDLLIPKDSE